MSAHINQTGVVLVPFGPDANCTLEICPLEWSVFQYQPSIAANVTLLSIFGALLILHAIQGIIYRTWGYMTCMMTGCVLQIVGYVGRIMLHDNPFDFGPFLVQIICITIAPVFYCAAVYVLLSQFITQADASLSRLNPKFFYCLFIPADIVCLVLQATGGALSAAGETNEDVDTGVDVSKAGLILQVIVLVVFLSASVDYVVRYGRRHGGDLLRRLRIFLGFIFLAVIFILVRCIYRIIELEDGYFGPAFRHQWDFVILEGAMMCIAVFCLNLGHPGRSLYRTGKERIESIEL